MYIFSRTRLARAGSLPEATAGGVEAAQKVTQITGHDVFVWHARFGAPVGTIMWSVRVESQAELFEATEKLAVDSSYMDLAMSLSEHFEGPTTDNLVRVVSGTPTESPSKFISSTQAAMANGRYGEAIEFGTMMQEFVSSGLGLPGIFGTATYGGFADVIWLTGADTMAEVDAAQDWMMTNADYHAHVQSAAGLFVEGSGQRGLIERLN